MEKKKAVSNENLQLERGIGKMAAIMLCFNGIVGSGIFVSPKGYFKNEGHLGSILTTASTLAYFRLLVLPRRRNQDDMEHIQWLAGPNPGEP